MLTDEEERFILNSISEYMSNWLDETQTLAVSAGCVFWFVLEKPETIMINGYIYHTENLKGWNGDAWFEVNGLSQMMIGFRTKEAAMLWKLGYMEDF